MLTIPEALDYQEHAAAAKVAATRRPFPFTIQAMLAGAYVGVAVVLMVSSSGPFLAAGSPAVKLINGLVFGVALTLVLVAGAELVTSSMMTLTQGWARRSITGRQWLTTLLFTFFANMAGAFVFAGLVHLSGLMERGTPAGEMIASMLEAKSAESAQALFFRGILCNILVCLAVWGWVRLTSESAKLIMVFWCIFAFITSGFEHVVANMTTFGIGLFGGFPETSIGDFARNMAVVGLGNLVGGAVFIGLAYVSYQARSQVSKDAVSTH